jgi:integrase
LVNFRQKAVCFRSAGPAGRSGPCAQGTPCIHDLRHTYASLLIAQGESLAYVRDQISHHSIKVTVDTYGHLVPGGNKAAVDRLDDAPAATIRNPAATSVAAAELGAR